MKSQWCITTCDGMTLAVSSTTPKVPAVPQNDQHSPAVFTKTIDGGIELKPSMVSLCKTTAPVFKEAKSCPLKSLIIGENAVWCQSYCAHDWKVV